MKENKDAVLILDAGNLRDVTHIFLKVPLQNVGCPHASFLRVRVL
jgi:hypothetical protein